MRKMALLSFDVLALALIVAAIVLVAWLVYEAAGM